MNNELLFCFLFVLFFLKQYVSGSVPLGFCALGGFPVGLMVEPALHLPMPLLLRRSVEVGGGRFMSTVLRTFVSFDVHDDGLPFVQGVQHGQCGPQYHTLDHGAQIRLRAEMLVCNSKRLCFVQSETNSKWLHPIN